MKNTEICVRRVRSGIRFIMENERPSNPNPYYRRRKKAGFLVIAGDKGLCGSYDSEVLKLAAAPSWRAAWMYGGYLPSATWRKITSTAWASR